MSKIIKFELKELRRLVEDKNSCVEEKKVKQKLALQPWCLGNLKESVKKVLDYKIGKFDKEYGGILLSYKNLRVLQNVGAIRSDSADIHFETQADYFIFKPRVGATLRGVVNKKSITHLGVLVHRVFNVVIPRPTEEPGAKWLGDSIQEGQEVIFHVVVLDLFGALPYIRGQLDERSLIYAENGDEIYDLKQQNYVNFDKTKPSYVQKQYYADGMQILLSIPNKKNEKGSDSPIKPQEAHAEEISNEVQVQRQNNIDKTKYKQPVKQIQNRASESSAKLAKKCKKDV